MGHIYRLMDIIKYRSFSHGIHIREIKVSPTPYITTIYILSNPLYQQKIQPQPLYYLRRSEMYYQDGVREVGPP